MKKIKKYISVCLLLCMVLSMLPATVFAEKNILPENFRFTWINPLYADSVAEADLVISNHPVLYADNTGDGKYYDAKTAGKMIRDDLVARDTTISVNISFPYNEETVRQDAEEQIYAIMASAMAHTGNPVEGDYLLWQFTGFDATFGNYTFSGQNLGATVTFTMTYHADAAQEAEMNTAVSRLLGELNVSGKDDYTKLKAIYDYITANVTYDYDNLNDNSYKLKHTAYAALINKTAVCQGYSALLYRLALELGVDCRIIPGNSDGQAHVWNIAELNGRYYNLDATWDADLPQYQCFLIGSKNFTNHDRWDKPGQMPSEENYNSDAFHAVYPMSETDYTNTNGGDHTYTAVVTNPTCTESGYTTYTCACGDTYIGDEVAALGHDVVVDKGYAANCTKEGLTDGKHCNRCSTVLTKQETIPAQGHSWDEGKVTKEPTEQETGIRTLTCSACGETRTETIPKLDHEHKHTAVVTDPTCTEKGYTTYTCTCGDTYTGDEVAALGHKEVADKGYAATCTEEGLTDGVHCGRCSAVLTKQEPISALGHSWDEGVVTKEPTEKETGIRTYTCSTCGQTKTEEIPAIEHEHIYKTVITEPTCTEAGYTTYTCTCGDTYAGDEVAALGHHEVTDKGIAATCTEAGLTEGSHCDRCGTVLTEQESISALGHAYDEGTVTTEPTCTGEGVKTFVCANSCGVDVTETVPAKGHDFEDGTCVGCGVKAAVIKTQPKTGYAKLGEIAIVTVEAEGDELSYQWYIRNADGTKYSKSAVTGPAYTCRMSEKSKDRRALCIITDKYGNKVQTKTVVIREVVSIVTEPKTAYAKSGTIAMVTMEASGDELNYQWYIRNANQTKYVKSSVTGPTYSCKMSDASKDRRALCIITDKYGNKIQTKTVVIRMAATITTQPKSVAVAEGKTAKVTVEAVGDGLTYQWYIKNEGASKFSKSSVTKATYSVKMSDKADGRQVYCVVTDKYGKTAQTSIVTLNMK